jgi:hypothetical protein
MCYLEKKIPVLVTKAFHPAGLNVKSCPGGLLGVMITGSTGTKFSGSTPGDPCKCPFLRLLCSQTPNNASLGPYPAS